MVITPCYVLGTLVLLASSWWCSSPSASFFARRGSAMLWSHPIFASSATTPVRPVVALVCPGLQTSYFTLREVTPSVAWTWSVCHLLVGVEETLLLLLHLLRKVSATSMLALAGPTALTSPRLVSPPLVPSGLRLRSSSLASLNATNHILRCPLGRLIVGSSVASRLSL